MKHTVLSGGGGDGGGGCEGGGEQRHIIHWVRACKYIDFEMQSYPIWGKVLNKDLSLYKYKSLFFPFNSIIYLSTISLI